MRKDIEERKGKKGEKEGVRDEGMGREGSEKKGGKIRERRKEVWK